jgi:hypothetical protein
MTETKHNNAKPQPFKQYGFAGATSAREASFLKMKLASEKQQSFIGGSKPKRKRNTMKKSLLRNISNRMKRKTKRMKRKTKRVKRKTNRMKRKTNRMKRKTTRGGSGGKTSGRATTVDVPSFSVVGNSPINANSISQSANSIMMQSDADSVYDHYADGGDIQKQSQNGGGSKYSDRNEWYKAFPPNSDDKSNTG